MRTPYMRGPARLARDRRERDASNRMREQATPGTRATATRYARGGIEAGKTYTVVGCTDVDPIDGVEVTVVDDRGRVYADSLGVFVLEEDPR